MDASEVMYLHQNKKWLEQMYVAMKYVDVFDMVCLKYEIHIKFLQFCKLSCEKFLKNMYRGMVELIAMPPFTL